MNTKKSQTINTSRKPVSDWLQTSIVGLFNLLLLTVPLFFSFNTEELFEFNKLLLVYFISICIGLVWVARMTVHQKFIFRTTKLDIPILIFLLSQLLSTVFSIHPYTSLLGYYTRFHGGLVSTLCYILLYYAFVSNIEKRHLKGLLITTVVGTSIASLYAVLEHFGHSFSCYLVTGGQSFGTDCWVQDVKNRVFSTFGQPNWLAAYLITLIPLFISCSVITQKKWWQLSSIAVTGLTFATALYTKSRSGLLGLGLGLGVYFALFFFLLARKKESSLKKIALHYWPIGMMVLVFSVLFLVTDNPFSQRITGLFSNNPSTQQLATSTPATDVGPTPVVNRLEVGGSDSADIRRVVWKGAFQVWKRYPIFGSGVETFAYSYYLDRPVEHNHLSEWDFLYNKAHNEFLNFLATTGLVGFLSYCALLVMFGYHTFRRYLSSLKKNESTQALLYASLLSGVIALSVSNFFGFSTVAVTVVMYLFFALSEIFSRETYPEVTPQKELLSWQYTIFLLFGIIGCIFFLRLYNYWSADVAYAKGKAYMAQGELDYGLSNLNVALIKTPQEAQFYDTLASEYAKYAVEFAKIGAATDSAQLAERAIQTQDLVFELNSHNVNFYKTRAQVLITLSQLDPKYLEEAKKTLENARALAPTDPKLVYNLALMELSLNQEEQGITHLEEAVAMKPNYDAARMQLAQLYESKNKLIEALEQYQYIVTHISPDNTLAQDKIATLSGLLQK